MKTEQVFKLFVAPRPKMKVLLSTLKGNFLFSHFLIYRTWTHLKPDSCTRFFPALVWTWQAAVSHKSNKFDSIASFTMFGYWGNCFREQWRLLSPSALLATIVNRDPRSKMATITIEETEGSHLLRPIKTSQETATQKTFPCSTPFSLRSVRCDKPCMLQGSGIVLQQLGGWLSNMSVGNM